MVDINTFKKKYTKAIQNGDAAIFAGAGLSIPSGYVNWKELLNNLATEIGLDVEKEPDLIEVAQYYCNKKRNRNEKSTTAETVVLFGAGNRGRTCTVAHRNLNPACLPIPPYPHNGSYFSILCQKNQV